MTAPNRSYPLGRLQWIWWWSPMDWHAGLHFFKGGLQHIYRWSFQFGPFEVRHWTPTGSGS